MSVLSFSDQVVRNDHANARKDRRYAILICSSSPAPSIFFANSPLDLALAGINLDIRDVDPPKLHRLTIGQIVHCCLSDVEARRGMINCQDVDGLAVVCQAVASTALERFSWRFYIIRQSIGTYHSAVPSCNPLVPSNIWVGRDSSLCLPTILGDQAVGTIRAGDSSH